MARDRLVYDDDCGFCTYAALWVVERGADVELVAFSELSNADRELAYRVVAANRDWFGRHVGTRTPPTGNQS